MPSDAVGRLRRIGEREFGPVVLALGLAIAALPLTTIAILIAPNANIDVFQSFETALGSSIGGALLGGLVGAWFRRRSIPIGTAVTLMVAWFGAISAFTWIPQLLGSDLKFGQACFRGCGPMINTAGGWTIPVVPMALGYFESLIGLFYTFPFVIVALIAALLLAGVIGPSSVRVAGPRRQRLAFVAWAVGWGAANVLSVLAVPGAYAVLMLGVLIWSWLLPAPTHRSIIDIVAGVEPADALRSAQEP